MPIYHADYAEANFDYDTTPPDEALPGPGTRLIPIESATDGGVIAWTVDRQHAAAIVRALSAASGEYDAEMTADCWVDGELQA